VKRSTLSPPLTDIVPPPATHAIRRVLDEKAVRMVYQPVVDLRTHRIFAYEALVRSKAPEFASPPDLFNAAVEHSCTGELGRMLRELSLEGCPDFPLFLNIHPAELNERWIVQPNDPIFMHDRDVYLEITEGVPLSHFHLCQTILSEVRDRGVYLVVDDLGAGYSNLKYIADLQPRVVKLDRGLIAGLTQNTRLFKLVSAIVVLCTELDALVVAEGIETVEELEAVIASGAQYGQGYLLARPAFPLPEVTWPAELGGPQPASPRRRGEKPTLKPRTTTKTRRR
jgi:EAL domain-containing protein (putative c-di-GMP-specific phosphodiesterase class I)